MIDDPEERPENSARERVRRGFYEFTGKRPSLWARAPGRVNLIGDHTDYNDGFVLPMAIDRATWLALEPTDDHAITLRSLDLARTHRFSLDTLAEATPPGSSMGAGAWFEYARGVAWALIQSGRPVRGLRGVVASDLPIGAGLSSSAALELAIARALVASVEGSWSAIEMAELTQRAEREWVGMNCGIMDQLVCAAGQSGHALLIDCRSLVCEPVPIPEGAAVVILDTGTRRGLVDSAYGARRARCEQAARALGVAALRDVTLSTLEKRRAELDATTYRRARHVIAENQRTVAAADALRAGDAARFGSLMTASHDSLRDDYEVSGTALDTMVARAHEHPACRGARLTGAGFAGCAVALVQAEYAAGFAASVTAEYTRAMGSALALPARAYVCRAVAGAESWLDGSRPEESSA